jgi:hypothetical protein
MISVNAHCIENVTLINLWKLSFFVRIYFN